VRPGIGTTDSRSRRRRMFTWALLGGVGLLLVNAIVGENGYLATLQLERTEAGLTNALARVRIENQQLRAERERLQTDPDAIEYAIREQLGFIRPGETTVIVHETPALSPVPPSPRANP
jgi:cell division protein FtsB